MAKKTKNNASSIRVYRRLLGYVKPYLWAFFISVIGFLLYSATQPLFAAVIKHIIDTLQSDQREKMLYLPLLFVGLFFIRGVGTYLGNYFLAKVSNNVVHDLRCAVFDQYTLLPTEYFDKNNHGYLISRITHNVGEVTTAVTDAVRTFVREGLTVLGLLAYLFYSEWRLTLIFLTITPVIAIMVGYVSKRLRRLGKNIQDSVGDMTHVASELIHGNRIVRSYGGQEYEKKRFHQSSWRNRSQSLKLSATMAIHNPLMQFFISLALAGLMYLALFIMEDSSAGSFVGYLTAAFMLPKPIRQLSDANSLIQKGIVAAESIFEVLDEEIEKDTGHYEVDRVDGEIEYKNVFFSYDKDKNVLDNLSFKIKPGQTVALVGPSGGGKSSIINLLPRFYDYEKGQILLDGVEITDYTLASLRKQIALVSQNVTLFNDTVANNIAYGELNGASREDIIQAAKDAYALEFIEKLPEGFDTNIGEQGISLSGGQRQRLALARAILKNASVLILDEATSALDVQSEKYIQAALDKIMKGRTTIVIAHRLSTIVKADVIFVIKSGKIAEKGTHQALLEAKGLYWALQKDSGLFKKA
ncbi:lipid A export permease/ATP-binding protein MsbA [methane-oxidizing endosymbiont of Gigantopelta aegis]|uniref:lipid A export permease/ATP-binding protein MsbA n=1 Tax=methane-oxidizing endosymbiont of Gigantopelta aegis TaxID=2794938 RepID=UPI0018DBC041|nr:lipid A export permease/ATP-binding protein MsbA [methane-oxidizing endosymbiont of Gigantopelta aegis]